jgi:hypothetical protein
LAYELAVENGGAFGSTAGLLSPGLEVELTGLSPITAAVVGSVTRTAGGAGIAFLSFADDGAALQYAYTQSPEVDRVGVALAISVPTGAAGRVVETAAVGGGFFRVDIVGDNLVATVSDGSTLLTASRALPARDEPFGFTAALGPSSLLLALSGDAEGAVVAAARGAYVAPTAETLRIGGPGADIFGGRLMHPASFDAAGVATAAADVFAVYGAVDPLAGWSAPDFTQAKDTTFQVLTNAAAATMRTSVYLDPDVGGIIMESGGEVSGIILYMHSGVLYFKCGRGGSIVGGSDTAEASITISTADTYSVIWSASGGTNKKAALYLNGDVTLSNTFTSNTLTGGDAGAIGRQGGGDVAANRGGFNEETLLYSGAIGGCEFWVGDVTSDVV